MTSMKKQIMAEVGADKWDQSCFSLIGIKVHADSKRKKEINIQVIKLCDELETQEKKVNSTEAEIKALLKEFKAMVDRLAAYDRLLTRTLWLRRITCSILRLKGRKT